MARGFGSQRRFRDAGFTDTSGRQVLPKPVLLPAAITGPAVAAECGAPLSREEGSPWSLSLTLHVPDTFAVHFRFHLSLF